MQLTPREKDKLLIAMAAQVARRRLERGVKLNHPEAIALITDFVVEGARDPAEAFSQHVMDTQPAIRSASRIAQTLAAAQALASRNAEKTKQENVA